MRVFSWLFSKQRRKPEPEPKPEPDYFDILPDYPGSTSREEEIDPAKAQEPVVLLPGVSPYEPLAEVPLSQETPLPPGYAAPGQPGYDNQQAYDKALQAQDSWLTSLSGGYQKYDGVGQLSLSSDMADTAGLDSLTAIVFRACFREIPENKRAQLYAQGGSKFLRKYALKMADNLIARTFPLVGYARWLKSWFVRSHRQFRP